MKQLSGIERIFEMDNTRGALVISLDFELLWGMLDKETVSSCKQRMHGARKAVEELLRIFSEYEIHATWGIVGSLLNDNTEDLINSIPGRMPQYEDKNFGSYAYYDQINDNDSSCFFAKDLAAKIQDTPNQEIASHTYSHYYCLADGQTKEDFEKDLDLYFEKINAFSSNVSSIIFPRNQINKNYVEILKDYGIKNYRGTEYGWCFQSHGKEANLFARGFRLADAYINLTGPNCYGYDEIREGNMNNIRSSRFLRPYAPKLSMFESLKLHRIKRQMLYAAKNGKIFHLWWHPHNFGIDLDKNLHNLEELLDYYCELKAQYGFESHTMAEIGIMVEAMQSKGN